MENKKNVPAIRFKGFTCIWVSKKFDKTFSTLSNNTLSRADLNYEKGSTKNVHYGDILIKFGECTDVDRKDIPYISDEKIADKYIASRLQDGDIVFADTAEDVMVGKCTELFNVKEQPIISGLHTIPCHPLFPFSTGYLGYFLNSSAYHTQLLSLMQGIKVVGISKTAIKETNVSFPENTDEQQAIGNFFQNIDRLINTSQAKLDKLKTLKKACLEKMFPKNGSTIPKLRFKGFAEEWKPSKLNEILRMHPFKPYLAKPILGGKYAIIQQGDNPIVGYANGEPFYDYKNVVLFGDHTLSLYKPRAPFFVATDGIRILSGDEVNDGDYLLCLLVQNRPNSEGYKRYYSSLVNKQCFITINQQEQIKIGKLFKTTDDLIAKTEQKINKLKNIKKACLDKMFVNRED